MCLLYLLTKFLLVSKKNMSLRMFNTGIVKGQKYIGCQYTLDLLEFANKKLLQNIDVHNVELARSDPLMYQLHDVYSYSSFIHKKETIRKQSLFIGSDHSLSMASIPSVYGKSHMNNVGVVWVDAHKDLHTPKTSPSGNYHGMSVAGLLGLFDVPWINSKNKLNPDQIVYIGTRSYEPEEMETVKSLGIKCFYMEDVIQLGIRQVMKETMKHLDRFDNIHISFDVDVLDPGFIACTGTPVKYGMHVSDGMKIVDMFNKSGKLTSMDIVEFNPLLGEYPFDEINIVSDLIKTAFEP